MLFAIAIFVFSSCNSTGQQKAKFNSSATNGIANSVKTEASEVIQKIEQKTYQGLNPGEIASDAVNIDADFIKAIINGACIIRKGNQEAMIDLKGKFIVPWGKYEYSVSDFAFPFTTLIPVTDPAHQKGGFINTKGQVVIPLSYESPSSYNCNRIALVGTDARNRRIYIDVTGKQIESHYFRNANSTPGNFGRPLYFQPSANRILFVESKTKGREVFVPTSGYTNAAGSVVIPNNFEDASDFSEGLAAVANKDQFGILKWGFIDASGKLVIPYTYQKRPGNFHHGLALVKPVENADFDYAYIDKQNNIKIKIGKGNGNTPYQPVGNGNEVIGISKSPFQKDTRYETIGYFVKNYAFWGDGYESVLLDTAGNFHKLAEIVKDDKLKTDKKGLHILGYDDLGIYFHTTDNSNPYGNYGMVDHDGNVLFPAFFTSIKPDYYSPYAYATRGNGSKPGIAGIINRQGVFVMLIGEKARF